MGLTTPIPVIAIRSLRAMASSGGQMCVPDVIEIAPLVGGLSYIALKHANHLLQRSLLMTTLYNYRCSEKDLIPLVRAHQAEARQYWHLGCAGKLKGAKWKGYWHTEKRHQ